MSINKMHSALFAWSIFSLLFSNIRCSKYNNDYGTNTNTGGGGNSTPPANEIFMQNDSYSPKSDTISKGTEITWVNKDSFNHTVTSGAVNNPNGLFDSGKIGAGGTFKHKFDSTGTFNYYCKIHKDIMTGIITVQ